MTGLFARPRHGGGARGTAADPPRSDPGHRSTPGRGRDGCQRRGSACLLEFLGLGTDILDFFADRSPLRQGRYSPGYPIPTVAPERLLEKPSPDHVLLLVWNFEEEILAQQAKFRRRSRFILPVPEVGIV